MKNAINSPETFELLKEYQQIRQQLREIGILGTYDDGKEIHIKDINTFIENFPDYQITKTQIKDYPYQLETTIEDSRFFVILSEEEYHTLTNKR